MAMINRLAVLLLVTLSVSCSAVARNEANPTLKADLAEVIERGKVEPVDGLTTAGQPDATGFRVFAESGYKVVIDLRTDGEDRGLDEPAVVARLGMEYVSMPIGPGDITFAKARELDALLAPYEEPVLIHCASSNRVGALLALREFDKTGNAGQALEVGREAGMTSLERTVTDLIGAD